MRQIDVIPVAAPEIGDEERNAVLAVLDGGHLAQGKEVEGFEREFAAWCGAGYAVAVNSGTAALHLLMLAHGIGEGDEVITTPFTFVASANAALFVGAKPVFVDVDPETLCLDPSRVEAAITPRTRALLPVDLYGHPASIHELRDIARRHGLVVIEDACQAHGASIHGVKTGAFDVSAAFSFYPTKNMTSGEGGMVTTNDPDIARVVSASRQHGAAQRYEHETLGYNFRLTDLAAAIGRVQLAKLDEFNARRRRNASVLDEELAEVDGVITPVQRPGYRHVYHQYTIRLEKDRDGFQARLREDGVGSAVHYSTPVHRQPLYRRLGYGDVSLPVSESASATVLSLPVHPRLTDTELDRIADSVKKAAKAA